MLNLAPAPSSRRGNAIATNLQAHGFHTFRNALPPRRWFAGFYAQFDALATRLECHPDLAESWNALAAQWLARGDNAAYWCSVPPAFKDRTKRLGKRDKIYLQYSVPFAFWLAHREPDLLDRLGATGLFEALQRLHVLCSSLFNQAIVAIADGDRVIAAQLRPSMRPAPIVLKAIRYNPNAARFGADAHYDKSALSLLVNADDYDSRVRIGPYRAQGSRLSDLVAPVESARSDTASGDAVVIVGACLREIGLASFGPTPHAVLPVVQPRRRHSVVAFHLVPHLDASHVETAAPVTNDVFPNVS